MMACVLLAIETSQRSASVAVALPDGRIAHEALRATDRHEDDLMPAIHRLFKRNALDPRDLGAVAVSIGPGGFTGLRIAVSTAKMLAESLGAKIVAVPSALVAAEQVASEGPLLVCMASKRETTWATHVVRGEERDWRITGTAGLVTSEAIDLAGIALVLTDEFLPPLVRERITTAGIAIEVPTFDARACLAVAQRMLAAHETTDSLSLQPIYAREPEAVRLWEKKAPRP